MGGLVLGHLLNVPTRRSEGVTSCCGRFPTTVPVLESPYVSCSPGSRATFSPSLPACLAQSLRLCPVSSILPLSVLCSSWAARDPARFFGTSQLCGACGGLRAPGSKSCRANPQTAAAELGVWPHAGPRSG